ncbi:hypothetical protein SDC9_145323 [bioreactor metagenome]|uniref:Uncharacterized protein n=1 Tax=bioreactor metagenome TaxID=1076179 RepID=A0A645E8N3_9ZZZZ
MIFIQSLQLGLGLQHQTGRDLPASDGGYQFFQLGNLTDIRCLINKAAHMHRQTSAIDVICLVAQQIEELRVSHGNQEVEGVVGIADDDKKRRFPIT